MPKLSVIVPVYNVKPYLQKCVDSILAQTLSDLELILVDDGSTDGSGELCDVCATQDPRVVVVHKPNGGQASARNRALDIATGEYLGFIDSDDYIHPQMYEILLQLLTENDADMAQCALYNVGPDTVVQPVDTEHVKTIPVNLDTYFQSVNYECEGLMYSVCNKLYKREIFDGLRFLEGNFYEDAFITPDSVKRCKTVVRTDCPLYYYVAREGSTMRSAMSPRYFGMIDVKWHFYEFGKASSEPILNGKRAESYALKYLHYYRIGKGKQYKQVKALKRREFNSRVEDILCACHFNSNLKRWLFRLAKIHPCLAYPLVDYLKK